MLQFLSTPKKKKKKTFRLSLFLLNKGMDKEFSLHIYNKI